MHFVATLIIKRAKSKHGDVVTALYQFICQIMYLKRNTAFRFIREINVSDCNFHAVSPNT